MRCPELWALLLAASLAPTLARAETCAAGVVDLRDADTTARFRVEVMDTEPEREKGLMFRESLPKYGGMLFVYEAPQPVAFWMENTLIPLDMLFFDQAGRLTRVHENARPRDRTPIPGGDDIRYVLEVNAGTVKALGIELGAELRHPALDQAAAAWPCAK
ncbi:DUF192 domain-containing protein [Amaricoccus sp.]|uniref:DUF192 domain-containing protein n=1 Tax=Amaricoccus sp. TaxID=1872485 RepID=UPI00261F30A1|nr:DUF192 domain-containing protein [uncultured Amaricoccus sp.]